MSISHFGLDGGIGPPKTAQYGNKNIIPGQKTYTKTFSRMSIYGGITKHGRDYSGKVELTPQISGGVQADSPTVAGVITRTAFRTISGGVQADSPTVSGSVNRLVKTVSGGVQAQDATVLGTVTSYPLTGWSLTDFTVDHAGLDPDSPFTNPIYSSLVSGDKCHHETLTDPDSHTMTMDGLGEFTISPVGLTGPQTFDVQIYDLSDGTFGTISTITVHPEDANSIVEGGVQASDSTVSGSLNSFTVFTVSGGVQADVSTVLGNLNTGGVTDVFGGVQADNASVSGSLERLVTLSGGIQADAPIVSGILTRIMSFSGGVQADSPILSGSVGQNISQNIGSKKVRMIKKSSINRRIKTKQVKR